MNPSLVKLLRCPKTKQKLYLEAEEYIDGRVYSGVLISEDRQNKYPIREFIPRFVPKSNYADSFGMQWNIFSKTQLDSYSGHPISYERLWKATGWNPNGLENKLVLDVGCGAGRFAEIALNAGANVVAMDYSRAVDACYNNLRHFSTLNVIQADIYSMPFAEESFDFVYCLGVLQHTPDVEKAFMALPHLVKKGGVLCIDIYEKSIISPLLPKYWLRPITKRIPKVTLFSIVKNLVPFLLPISIVISKIPIIGKYLRRIIPVANYSGVYPLDEKQIYEWAVLDTFDWLSPEYDQPQKEKTIKSWFEKAGMRDIEVLKAGHLVGRGRK